MKKNILYSILFSVLLQGVATNGNATTVGYSVSNVGGNRWEYTYSITNDSLDTYIDLFTVDFDYERYRNLVSTNTPVGWISSIVPTLPSDDGAIVACSDDFCVGDWSGIAPGDTLRGFSVQFDYLGAGTPGFQFFQIVDPGLIAIADEGHTIASPVPLPPALWLFMSGIAMLVSQRKALLA